MENKGLGDIVLDMLLLAKDKNDSKESLHYLEDMSKRNSDSLRLGKSIWIFNFRLCCSNIEMDQYRKINKLL